ncbi:MAG: hypothetical protein FD174_2883 [Geobacteraceae bacterium]|nr:MAG: hypothetical protein FD174_2883 [Geobacteraceae bacterium]
MKGERLAGNRFVHVFLIVILGLSAYSNTFHVPFVFDDQTSIIDNPVIRDLANFFSSGTGYGYNPRRFVGYLTIALNYRLGGVDVTGYHAFNLTVHIITALLVYYLCLLTFRTPSLLGSSLSGGARQVALLSGLLFVVHPVQTEAVTYIIQRLSSLAAMFYLLSLVFYVRARLFHESGNGRVHGKTVLSYSLSLISAVLAMKTKEIAFTLPIIIALHEFFFFRGGIRKRLLFLLPIALTIAIIPFTMVSAGKPIGKLLADAGDAARGGADISRGDYLITQVSVITTYVRLLFLPINQNLDYDYPLSHSLLNPRVFVSFLFLFLIASLAIYLFRRSRIPHPASRFPLPNPRFPVPSPRSPIPDPALRLVSFGICWFFITLSVESSVIPLADVIFEHRLYLPSAGALIAAATAAAFAARKFGAKAVGIVSTAVVLAFSAGTWKRNLAWGDPLTLWGDVVAKSPGKARPRYNLGTALNQQGFVDEAIDQFQIALRLDPANADVRHNLGVAYVAKGLMDEAIKEYRAAIGLNPASAQAHNSLGGAYVGKGLIDEAIEEYGIALRLDPSYADAHNNLGAANGVKGKIDEAVAHLEAAVRLRPDNADFHNNLARAYELKGWGRMAEAERRAAERLGRR